MSEAAPCQDATLRSRDQFILLEYEQCIGLIKYYDERQADLVKFVSGLSAAVPSGLFAISRMTSQEATQTYWWPLATVVLALTAIGIFSILTALVQIRAYFTFVARQTNSIRSIINGTDQLFPNRLWTDPNRPAFDWHSAHTLQFLFVCVQGALFVGLAVCSSFHEHLTSMVVVAAVVISFTVLLLIMLAAKSYLSGLPITPDAAS